MLMNSSITREILLDFFFCWFFFFSSASDKLKVEWEWAASEKSRLSAFRWKLSVKYLTFWVKETDPAFPLLSVREVLSFNCLQSVQTRGQTDSLRGSPQGNSGQLEPLPLLPLLPLGAGDLELQTGHKLGQNLLLLPQRRLLGDNLGQRQLWVFWDVYSADSGSISCVLPLIFCQHDMVFRLIIMFY